MILGICYVFFRIELPSSPTSTMYRPEYLVALVRKIQIIICEQEWVTEKMFKVCTLNRALPLHESLGPSKNRTLDKDGPRHIPGGGSLGNSFIHDGNATRFGVFGKCCGF